VHRESLHACRAAGLDDGEGIKYPKGNDKGQAGWNVAIQFDSLADLADKLKEGVPMPCDNWFYECPKTSLWSINRLAIKAHGAPGEVAVDGKSGPILSVDSLSYFMPQLRRIGVSLSYPSTVLLMSCLAGRGPEGTDFLLKLSAIWP